MASLKDICGHVVFDIILKEIDLIDDISDRYKYASFDIQVKHGDALIRPDGPNHISIYLIKRLLSKLNEIAEGVLCKRYYDERWAYFSLEPLDQSFILDIEFQGFENDDSCEETIGLSVGFHSFMVSQDQYPGYVIAVKFLVEISKFVAFTQELENEFKQISEAYHVWSYEI